MDNAFASFLVIIIGLPLFILIISKINTFTEQLILFGFGKWFRLLSSFIGTPVHELSHMIMCFIFSHKIEKVCLLNLNPNSEVLGYVHHSYNRRNLIARIGNFFIGIAPIFVGFIFSFIIFDKCMVNIFTVKFWIALIIISQIVTHMRCSKADIKNALDGFIFFILLLVLILFYKSSWIIILSKVFLKMSFLILCISSLNLVIIKTFIQLIKR